MLSEQYPEGYIEFRKLDQRVMVVAKVSHGREWAAYIGAVTGKKDEDEMQAVLENGSKLSTELARVLFKHLCHAMLRYRE